MAAQHVSECSYTLCAQYMGAAGLKPKEAGAGMAFGHPPLAAAVTATLVAITLSRISCTAKINYLES